MNEATLGGSRFGSKLTPIPRCMRRWADGPVVVTRGILVTHLREAMLEELRIGIASGCH
jgi:hypothetical protein